MNYIKNVAANVSDRVSVHGAGRSYTGYLFSEQLTPEEYTERLEKAFSNVYLTINIIKARETGNGVSIEFSVVQFVDDILDASKEMIEKGDHDRAIRHLNIASIIDMDNGNVHYELGNAYTAKGNKEKASEHYFTAYNLAAGELGW